MRSCYQIVLGSMACTRRASHKHAAIPTYVLRASRRAVISAGLLLIAVGIANGQSDTLWQYDAPEAIRFFRVDPAGRLLVVTQRGLVAVDADAGTPAWRYQLDADLRMLRAADAATVVVAHGRTITTLDAASGDTVWHRSDLPQMDRTSVIARPDRLILQTERGFAVLDPQRGVTRWDSTALPPDTRVREYFPIPDRNLLVLVARTPAASAALLGVTLDSGRVIWRHDSLFQHMPKFESQRGVEYLTEYQHPMLFEDSTLLLYFSKDGPLRMDPVTGRVVWRGGALSGRAVPGRDLAYPAVHAIDSVLLIPTEKRLVALHRDTGTLVWSTQREFRDRLSWMLAFTDGILVGGFGREKPFLDYLDPRTGRSRWPAALQFDRQSTALSLADTVWVVEKGAVSAVPLATGVPRRLAQVAFGGGEQPARIDRVESGGMLLLARQNIARVDAGGHVTYHRYFKAPGTTFWAKLASTALIAATNVASIALTPPGGLAPVITSNPRLSERYAWAATAEHFYYVFTEARDSTGERGFSLVVVDRRDGRELGRMWFDDRSPDYGLDHATGTVYVKESDRRMVARRFALDRPAPAHCDPMLESLSLPPLDMVLDSAALEALLTGDGGDNGESEILIRFAQDGELSVVRLRTRASESDSAAVEARVRNLLRPIGPQSAPLGLRVRRRPGGGGLLLEPDRLTCKAHVEMSHEVQRELDSLTQHLRPAGDTARMVTVRYVVEANGTLKDIKVERSSGLPELDALLVSVLGRTTGEAARVGRTPVAVSVRRTVIFGRPTSPKT